jgi:hypothetical protein
MGDEGGLPRYEQHRHSVLLPDPAPEDEAGPAGTRERPSTVVRALSVAPFLLVASVGLIAVVSWVLIIVLGLGAAEPIWRWASRHSTTEVVLQLLVAVLVTLAPLAVTGAASWAALYGFRPASGRLFWAAVEAAWGVAAIGLVVVDRTRDEWLRELGFTATDWWFAFGVVAFAMVMAGVRLRAWRADS